MKDEIIKLVEQHGEIEEKILRSIDGLENDGADCNCKDRVIFKYVHEGNFDEIMEVCLNCGGIIN